MSKIVLKFPIEFFKMKFVEELAKKSLGVNGYDLTDYLTENVHNRRGTGLFKENIVYCCQIVDNRVLLVGTNIN